MNDFEKALSELDESRSDKIRQDIGAKGVSSRQTNW